MSTYSFRAECPIDVARFILAADAVNARAGDGEIFISIMNVTMRSLTVGPGHHALPDVTFEFESLASLEQLRTVIRNVANSHVMLQTLRDLPLSENRMERDWSVS